MLSCCYSVCNWCLTAHTQIYINKLLSSSTECKACECDLKLIFKASDCGYTNVLTLLLPGLGYHFKLKWLFLWLAVEPECSAPLYQSLPSDMNVKWVTCHNRVACLQVSAVCSLQTWSIIVNILNKWLQTAERVSVSGLGVGLYSEMFCIMRLLQRLWNWMDFWASLLNKILNFDKATLTLWHSIWFVYLKYLYIINSNVSKWSGLPCRSTRSVVQWVNYFNLYLVTFCNCESRWSGHTAATKVCYWVKQCRRYIFYRIRYLEMSDCSAIFLLKCELLKSLKWCFHKHDGPWL
jgi:hypothetical protein